MRKTIIEIATGNVVNIILLNEGSEWTPEEGHAVGPDGGWIGARWNGTSYEWIVPPVVEE